MQNSEIAAAFREIPGIGDAISRKITEMLASGRLDYLERLRAEADGAPEANEQKEP